MRKQYFKTVSIKCHTLHSWPLDLTRTLPRGSDDSTFGVRGAGSRPAPGLTDGGEKTLRAGSQVQADPRNKWNGEQQV